jgi:hypothetical protein
MPVFHHAVTGDQKLISRARLKSGTVVADAEGVLRQFNAFNPNNLMDAIDETEFSNLGQGPVHEGFSHGVNIFIKGRIFQWDGGCQVNES